MKVIEEYEEGKIKLRKAELNATDNHALYWLDLAKELKREVLIKDISFDGKEVYYIEFSQEGTDLDEFTARAERKQKELSDLMSEVTRLLSYRNILVKLKRWGNE